VDALRPFSLLIKPASADCNLTCDYSFYLDRFTLYSCNQNNSHRMTYDTLAQLIKGYMQTPQPEYIFCWQGGEPILMGEEFFRKVIEM
jgi:uncharacterized protein